ncbi:hypothetical protein DR950_06535 [Kitasatospora xanthocidica]|uniref:Uncharacterized protein n=1 Tax=Kitasatospora xanthocidica TaxID=83382 RepID=A0A372ZQ16_9ACTN|nr:hypothetical protein [Kitasatospora xanthocidica]RGD57500.1 hypothetical protein DR950_06535 [Kitasatospora xanthocidica]
MNRRLPTTPADTARPGSFDNGLVVSVEGDPGVGPAVELARRTGRRHLGVPTAGAALEIEPAPTLTVVATAAAVDDRWLARASGIDGIGLLTARDGERLTALVSRTLSAPVRPSPRTVLLDATADGAAAVTRDGFSAATRSAGTLVLQAHGRECLVHLADGVLCGRSTGPVSVRPDGHRPLGPTSCVQGEGCYRLHYRGEELLPAASVDADVVLIDSCLVQKVGTGQFTSDTTLALTLLEGSARAVVASPWIRGGFPAAGPLFAALLRDGAPLGRAVAEVNRAAAAGERTVGRFALLGDAALRPHPEAALPAVAADGPFTVGDAGALLDGDPPDAFAVVHGDVDVVRLTGARTLVLPRYGAPLPATGRITRAREPQRERFDRLRTHAEAAATLWAYGLEGSGPEPSGYRAALADAYGGLADTTPTASAAAALDQAEDLLTAVDGAAAERLTALTAQSRYHFVDTYSDTSRRVDERPATCPECDGRAALIRWSHAIAPLVERELLSCPVCGEVTDTDTRAAVTCRLEGPRHAVRGEPLRQRAVLHNATARPVHARLGFALLYEDLYGTDWSRTEEVLLDPGEERGIDVGGGVPADFDVADRHGLRLFTVAGGRISTYSRYLWVTANRATRDELYEHPTHHGGAA